MSTPVTAESPNEAVAAHIDGLVAQANRWLVEFAHHATKEDCTAMNELVRAWMKLARATFVEFPADESAIRLRKLEFWRTRFVARNCRSLHEVPTEERNRIARLLFEPFAPSRSSDG